MKSHEKYRLKLHRRHIREAREEQDRVQRAYSAMGVPARMLSGSAMRNTAEADGREKRERERGLEEEAFNAGALEEAF